MSFAKTYSDSFTRVTTRVVSVGFVVLLLSACVVDPYPPPPPVAGPRVYAPPYSYYEYPAYYGPSVEFSYREGGYYHRHWR